MTKKRVVVWGASGKTGRALTATLTAAGYCVHGISRRQRDPDGQVTWWRPQELDRALEGADAAWLITPNMYPDEVALVRDFAQAAVRGGVVRLGYHSVLNPQDRAMPHHERKGQAEEVLRDVHGDVVVVRPSAYHDNLSSAALTGHLAVPYRVDAPFRTVDLRDVAEASVALLGEEHPSERVVELVGPEVLTIAGMANQAASVLGHRVTAGQIPISSDVCRDLRAMFEAYDKDGLLPVSGTDSGPLEELLGRAVITWAEHLRRAQPRNPAARQA